MGNTIVEKIAKAYSTEGPSRPLRAGDFVSIRPRHVMTHDNTSAVIKKFKTIGAGRIFNHQQPVFALDHDIQNSSPENLAKYAAIEAFAREHHIDFYPAGTGIGHQIMVERGYVVPGSFVVASDSHSNMYGALGAIGTPVVRTDAAAIWATGEFWWQVPRTIRVELKGKLQPGVSGKDVIIALCGLYNKEEVLNAAVEFAGPGVESLSMDARLTIANMTTEWGALVGWFPCDLTTIAYMRQVRDRLLAEGARRVTDDDIERWVCCAPRPDPDAEYAGWITLDLGQVTPHVSGPDTVQVMTSVAEVKPKKVAINKAYLISCTNSRLEDLEAAASVLEGKTVAASVKLYVAAASKSIQDEAERRGVWQKIVSAGAIELPPSCGPCIGLGTGLLEPGEVGISATNRNFKGRMGSKDAQCYLGSPEVVAASAVTGYITTPNGNGHVTSISHDFVVADSPEIVLEKVKIMDGFPARVKGRLVFLAKDNLNTDGIYAGTYTYREDMTTEKMAKVVFDNYDSALAAKLKPGDVIVGGFNFGTGSSREQAVTALKSAGIRLVIAGSFSQTYLRNAFNNGFTCIEIPALVKKLRSSFAGSDKSIIPGDEVEIDFERGVVTYAGSTYTFPALGSVPQSLVAAGGIESLVTKKLARKESL